MPINVLKDLIQDHLVQIDFKRPRDGYSHSPANCLKESILNGNGVDITVLDKKRFSVNIQSERYYEALATNYFYSYEKISRQRIALDSLLKNKASPGAWMLVTTYYQAFYSAIELARLMGVYNMSLNKDHLDRINDINSSAVKLSTDGAFIGYVDYLGGINDSITITFCSPGKNKPHELAWSNLCGLLNNYDVTKIIDGKSHCRVETLKEIINKNANRRWPSPSSLRNNWNYALMDAYSESADEKTATLKFILEGRDFSRAKQWADQRRAIDSDRSVTSLGYICIILETVMESVKSKLLKN